MEHENLSIIYNDKILYRNLDMKFRYWYHIRDLLLNYCIKKITENQNTICNLHSINKQNKNLI